MNNVFSHRTPIDDDYPTCLETRAELLIYPGEISPHEVTERLGIDPTKVNVAGEIVVGKRGHPRLLKLNGWFLSSESHVESFDVRRHLDWLLGRVESKAKELDALQAVPGVTMSINCVWYSRSGHGGPTLWPEQMRALADLNLECSFDIYFLPDDEK